MKYNRLLFILLLIFCFFISFTISCFAATGVELIDNSITINGYTYLLDNSNGTMFYLYNKIEDTVYLCSHYMPSHLCPETTLIIKDKGNGIFNIQCKCSHYTQNEYYAMWKYDKNSKKFILYEDFQNVLSRDCDSNVWNFLYSGMNISNDFDLYSSSFFMLPLPYQIQQVTQLPTAMVGVLKMIIPVSLIVLLAVFLIFLVKSVISRMV